MTSVVLPPDSEIVAPLSELAEPLVALTRKGAPLCGPVLACLQWGSSESDSRQSGGGYRVCQPQPSPVSAAILQDTS